MTEQVSVAAPSRQRVPFWRDVRVLQILGQIVFTLVIILIVWLLIDRLTTNLAQRGIPSGFGFLSQEAGFEIGEGITYSPADTYGRAFLVGVVNTLRVAALGIVMATLLGIVAGVARLASNWLVSKIASTYIEIIRNTPLLVQLFFWYFAVVFNLPRVRDSVALPGSIFINRRGVSLPAPSPSAAFGDWLIALLLALMAAAVVWTWRTRRMRDRPAASYAGPLALLAFGGVLAGAGFAVGASPVVFERPELQGLNFSGGIRFTPEFFALLLGLVVYTGAFIAEIVRGGILAVPRGQVEAAQAIGLNSMQTLRLVVFPQALRVIIPPLTSQYLNLTKNSSLAVAIGYPDLFAVGKTIQNQTGRPVPVIIIIMGTYLAFSLLTSLFMNSYNRRVRLVER
jgi:general L-amino acid transport system permease protein